MCIIKFTLVGTRLPAMFVTRCSKKAIISYRLISLRRIHTGENNNNNNNNLVW